MAKTKAKELTTEEKLQLLYSLQNIHSEIDEINTLRGELPMEVNDLEDEIVGLESRIEKLREEESTLASSIAAFNTSKDEAMAKIDRYAKQQNDVKNNREYDALTKEIELENLNIQLSDKKIRDSQSAIEGKKAYLAESEELLESRKADLTVKKEELEKIMEQTSKKEEKLIKKIGTQERKIEERLTKAYYRIRDTYRNGLAVVNIERESCGGCFAKIPPQRQLEIRQRKRIILCEHCGRIVVDFDGE